MLYLDDDLGMIEQVIGFCSAMFVICMTCHGELARQKPPPEHLTAFYLLVSVGGAVGGLFVNVFAPYVLNGYWELHIGILISMLLMGLSITQFREAHEADDAPQTAKIGIPLKIGFLAIVLMAGGFLYRHIQDELAQMLTSQRNFYGVLRVRNSEPGTTRHRHSMHHGNIVHGTQFWHEDERKRPTSYYTKHSGLGIAIRQHPRRMQDLGLKVGIIGLGAGTIAYYCNEPDYFRFYEINPVAEDLARNYFSFIDDAEGKIEVIIGDGRIMMERELEASGSQNYDVIAVDAFSGDAIPMHLLTTQAFALYFKHLKSDGILAVHISNRFVELIPVVRGQANVFGYPSVKFRTKKDRSVARARATWIIMTHNQEFLTHRRVTRYMRTWDNDQPDVVWTDDFSNLAGVLDF